jgi:hypothetical protein
MEGFYMSANIIRLLPDEERALRFRHSPFDFRSTVLVMQVSRRP